MTREHALDSTMNWVKGRANRSYFDQTANMNAESLATACYFSNTMFHTTRFKGEDFGIQYVAEIFQYSVEVDIPPPHKCLPLTPA